jgi:TrmH family RNA methyltransferase
MTLISSPSNPKVKAARALRQRKARQETGLFLVEGIRHVGEAAEAGGWLQTIFYAPELLTSEFALQLIEQQSRQGVECFALSRAVFESLAEKDNPQGVLAIARQTQHSLDSFSPENFLWGVALVEPQDPGNLGAILRAIDAVGASGALLLDSSVDAYHPAVVRASMGALFWKPMLSASFGEFESWARQGAYHVYGTSAHAAQDYRQAGKFQQPCILLLGSERQGLSAEQAAACESLLRLPMRGRATSLNLAVAAGILLYHMLSDFEPLATIE